MTTLNFRPVQTATKHFVLAPAPFCVRDQVSIVNWPSSRTRGVSSTHTPSERVSRPNCKLKLFWPPKSGCTFWTSERNHYRLFDDGPQSSPATRRTVASRDHVPRQVITPQDGRRNSDRVKYLQSGVCGPHDEEFICENSCLLFQQNAPKNTNTTAMPTRTNEWKQQLVRWKVVWFPTSSVFPS